jgi:hypothetical protein
LPLPTARAKVLSVPRLLKVVVEWRNKKQLPVDFELQLQLQMIDYYMISMISIT